MLLLELDVAVNKEVEMILIIFVSLKSTLRLVMKMYICLPVISGPQQTKRNYPYEKYNLTLIHFMKILFVAL